MNRSLISFLLVCLLLGGSILSPALGQTAPQVVPVELEGPGGRISYPRLEGHEDAMIQVMTNQIIMDRLDVMTLMERIQRPFEQITASYESIQMEDILSLVLTLDDDGKVTRLAACVDLSTGSEVTLREIFTDEAAALALMEEICLEAVEPLLSSYLENAQLFPIPLEHFALDEQGITFYYPWEQLSGFSGYAGSVTFSYYELASLLASGEGSLPERLGIIQGLAINKQTAENISACVSAGKLPGIAPALGDPLTGWLNAYRLLCNPDYYPGGRFFQMEDSRMRGVWLLTDALTESYDASLVMGVRADRINLWGIQPGNTLREVCLGILGEPENSVALDESSAMDYYLPAGISDYYTYGGHMLRLHYDEEGVLVSVQLLD